MLTGTLSEKSLFMGACGSARLLTLWRAMCHGRRWTLKTILSVAVCIARHTKTLCVWRAQKQIWHIAPLIKSDGDDLISSSAIASCCLTIIQSQIFAMICRQGVARKAVVAYIRRTLYSKVGIRSAVAMSCRYLQMKKSLTKYRRLSLMMSQYPKVRAWFGSQTSIFKIGGWRTRREFLKRSRCHTGWKIIVGC